ncbi:MAG: cob(I)yrinic acid a,c-diamide adenosyltransferase [Candidatus Marsarchaeota archaeon]|nr:cob(I)yrinic acid a,c-diamide adenosyltransferase [Candidatus Marsarchaeota archaeon]
MPIKYYTGFGDKKMTSIGSSRLGKSESIFYAIGDVDELNAKIGTLVAMLRLSSLKYSFKSKDASIGLIEVLLGIQSDLFSVGAELASAENAAFKPKRPITDSDIKKLSEYADSLGNEFPELKSFVLPGGCVESACADEARAMARRAERSIINASNNVEIANKSIFAYMNRLSSLLFVMARFINNKNGIEEKPPKY